MTLNDLLIVGVCCLLITASWVLFYGSYVNACYAKRWYLVAYGRCSHMVFLADHHRINAARSAGKAEACELAARNWVKASLPQCHDSESVLAAILEEHKNRPIPADAANSDWGRTVEDAA